MTQTMNIDTAAPIDSAKVDELVQKAVGDFGAVLVSSLVVVGDRLGLFRAMADGQPVTSDELAGRTGTNERNVREWLNALSAAGYVTYAGEGRYRLGAEQALLFTAEDSPAFVVGGFQVVTSAAKADEKLTAAFGHGHGIGWHEHHHDLFTGTERFFRPGYRANLVDAWIPALEGVEARLQAGAKVADIGCGHGASTIILAEAYPNSTFFGFDYHAPSITEAATAAARRRRRRSDSLRGRAGQGVHGFGLRLGVLLRLPARHGRPGRRARRTPAARCGPTARCCWSSPSRATKSTRTSIRWAASSTPRRR